MADDLLVLGYLDDLEDAMGQAKINDFGPDFIEKLQKLHGDLVDISNRLEGDDEISRMNDMLEKTVDDCFVNCRDANKQRAQEALEKLEEGLTKL